MSATSRITLQVLDGADRGRLYGEMPTPVTIGREEGNSVQLNDERVSRYHLKIQEDQGKVVLTDLDSTNGTKVNGEEAQLRILRFGDVITLGRTVLLFGSREQIAERLARLRGAQPVSAGTIGADEAASSEGAASLDFEVNWAEEPNARATLHTLLPPELPDRLSPGQAAQLAELLEYLHIRIRHLLNSVKVEGASDKVQLDVRRWQGLVDLQARLAEYLRKIGEPKEE
jgi:pSer/pThr/pTyr-binding forkhead associated (FHA) protein